MKTAQSFLHSAQFHLENRILFPHENSLLFVYHFHIGLISGYAVLFRLFKHDTTERPEALASGTVHLVGTDYQKIMDEVSTLLEDEQAYEKMSKAVNPYGDGKACERIVEIFSKK